MSEHTCRFCSPDPEDVLPSYASALVFPGSTGLRDALLDTEKVTRIPRPYGPQRAFDMSRQDLVPCFTAYCDRCRNVCLLNSTAALFPTRSAHHVHQIVLMRKLQAAGVLLT